jgi:hypothetical protein
LAPRPAAVRLVVERRPWAEAVPAVARQPAGPLVVPPWAAEPLVLPPRAVEPLVSPQPAAAGLVTAALPAALTRAVLPQLVAMTREALPQLAAAAGPQALLWVD